MKLRAICESGLGYRAALLALTLGALLCGCRSGGGPDGELNLIESATYNRWTRVLTASLNDPKGRDLTVRLSSAAFIETVEGNDLPVAGGVGSVTATLVFHAVTPDALTITVEAFVGDPALAVAAGTTTVDVKRPFYISELGYVSQEQQIRGALDGAPEAQCTVSATGPDGVTLTAVGATEITGSGDFAFDVSFDPLALPDAQVTVTISEQGGDEDSQTVSLAGQPAAFEPNSLYAYPLEGTAHVGDPVTIVVASGVPANPFAYVNGCRVELRDGTEYVPGSFNIGAPGGAAWDADGLWTGAAPAGFVQYGDSMITFYKDSIEGYDRYDFNVTPVDGQALTDPQGELFNFQLTFTKPGTFYMMFERYLEVPRTWYTGGPDDVDVHFWPDHDNRYPGVLNYVTVTE